MTWPYLTLPVLALCYLTLIDLDKPDLVLLCLTLPNLTKPEKEHCPDKDFTKLITSISWESQKAILN